MKRLLFGCFNRYDLPHVAALLSSNRSGVEMAVMSSILHPPAIEDLPSHCRFFEAPVVGDEPEQTSSGTEVLQAMLCGDDDKLFSGILSEANPELISPLPQYVRAARESYPAFVESVIADFDPDLVVCAGQAPAASITTRICRQRSKKVCFILPQFFEFNSQEPFDVPNPPAGCTFIASGPYGRQRLMKRGVPGESILIGGNSKFDATFAYRQESAGGRSTQARPCILYTMQGLPENMVLGDYLLEYLNARPEVTLSIRPHPDERLTNQQCARLQGSATSVKERVTIGSEAPLLDQLRDSAALVTISSLTILDGLILNTPVVSWHSSWLPRPALFVKHGDALGAADYKELEAALDSLIFDKEFKAEWQKGHARAYERYLSWEGVPAAQRTNDLIDQLLG